MKNMWTRIKTGLDHFRQDHPLTSSALYGVASIAGLCSFAALTGTIIAATIPTAAVLGGNIASAALSIGVLAGGAAALSSVGAFVIDTIGNHFTVTRTNEAGQVMQGPRWAVRRLENAQKEIHSITAPFNKTAVINKATREKINDVIEDTVDAQAKVRILEKGREGATSMTKVQFARAKLQLEHVNH